MRFCGCVTAQQKEVKPSSKHCSKPDYCGWLKVPYGVFLSSKKTFYKAIFMDGYPTNLSGVVYIPFTEGNIATAFHALWRELADIYLEQILKPTFTCKNRF
jgi:hypothetical protein